MWSQKVNEYAAYKDIKVSMFYFFLIEIRNRSFALWDGTTHRLKLTQENTPEVQFLYRNIKIHKTLKIKIWLRSLFVHQLRK